MNPNDQRSTSQAAADLLGVRKMEAQATDLNEVRETNEQKAREEANRRAAQAAAIVAAWDRKMRRAFKGIMASPLRYRMMRESYAKAQARGDA